MSVEYAKVREQFGQLIGSFQAIRHKLRRDAHGGGERHSAVYYAAWALEAGAEDAAMAASVAKSYVSEAARRVCGDAIQVHGGSASRGSTTSTSTSSAPRRWRPLYGDAEYHRELIVRQLAAR